MVCVNPNPETQGCYLDTSGMPLPGSLALATTTAAGKSGTNGTAFFEEDLNKKVRKPYTITKSRENWSEQEHDKFLEALQLFDRDWKKIEAFVGSKTVIQIRSHAQKYFLKVQKKGSKERVPPPRPKRKAAHPYPQKASKNAIVSQAMEPYQTGCAVFDPGYMYNPDSSSLLANPSTSVPTSPWTYGSVAAVSSSNVRKGNIKDLLSADDAAVLMPVIAPNCCCSSSNESTWPTGGVTDQGYQARPIQVIPDFAQVYSFIGSVFDPNATNHLQRLKKMDPINIETVLLLMNNLSVNLMSPDFEDHRRLLSSYDTEMEKANSCSPVLPSPDSPKIAIPAV
ncbi:hypothetical protein Nepgr_019114 [Nepenthes gracilis]|uniref:Uncharacterized protein n=1 Tax=Nepenthes gracilis TaxID=150966 RepID=A0AAD3STF8_NEPGR|nr:hypothetical protein Nepgr_019114 [Nepenthes gracilis]